MTKKSRSKRTLANGRSYPKSPQFLQLSHEMLVHKRFRQLPGSAVKILLYLCSKHNGYNNGKIVCSYTQMAVHLKIGKSTISANIQILIDNGFICLAKPGYFLGRKAAEYEITFLSSEGYKPTQLWKDPEQRPRYGQASSIDVIQDTILMARNDLEEKT